MTYSAHLELDSEKLGKIREQLHQTKSVFRDKSVLDSCKTDCIIGRQKEASKLLSYLDPKPQNHIPLFVEVFGRSGSGKSCVVELVCQSISDSVSYRITNHDLTILKMQQYQERLTSLELGINSKLVR